MARPSSLAFYFPRLWALFGRNTYQWHSKGARWRHAPWGTDFGGAPAHFFQSFKTHFKQKFRPTLLKNAYFLEKDVKFAHWPPAAGVSAPRPPCCYSRLLLQLCQSSFLALNALYCLQKRTNFASLKFLQLFFTSNSIIFVGRGRKNISCPRAQCALATPLTLIQQCCFKRH